MPNCARFKINSFAAPLVSVGSRLHRWHLILHKQEDEIPSTTGVFDKTLLLDIDETQWFSPILGKRERGNTDTEE